MSFIKTGFSAISKLLIVIGLAGAFLVGLLGVVYLSLRGKEIQVPEIVGKDKNEAEKELLALGLKLKKRADRFSEEKPNTILEQSPKAGTTAKTGQQILVVVSQVNAESTEAPAVVDKQEEEENTNSESGTTTPKKPTINKNANIKKPAQTTRDVSSNKTVKTSNTNTKTATPANTSRANSSSANTGGTTTPANSKPTATPANSPKPAATKTPTAGDTRERKIPN